MVPGLDGNNIIILQYRVSDQTSALARVRIGATYIIKFLNCRLRHQGTKNSILYFPDLEPVNYCQLNPEPMAIFITVTLTIIPTKSAINAAAKTNLVFLILTELE